MNKIKHIFQWDRNWYPIKKQTASLPYKEKERKSEKIDKERNWGRKKIRKREKEKESKGEWKKNRNKGKENER